MLNDLEGLATEIRVKSLKMVHAAAASHIGSALSIADILAVLYGRVLNVNPRDPIWQHRDRFILSKGHACVSLYAALDSAGFLNDVDLETYGRDFSILMNHVSHKVPGVEFSTGALGHGLPFAVGKSLASRALGSSWNTYVLLSDGELDEGSNWEALMFAAHHNLRSLTVIIDYNKLQSLGAVKETLSLEPLVDKLEAFGVEVIEVNGHNLTELESAFQKVVDRPKVVLAHTIKGKGVSFMENEVLWHYKNPGDKQLRQALEELNVK